MLVSFQFTGEQRFGAGEIKRGSSVVRVNNHVLGKCRKENRGFVLLPALILE